MRLFFIFLVFFVLVSCDKEIDVTYTGMAPIYRSYDDFTDIKTLPPAKMVDLGKIVAVNNTIFINEKLKGIHVIDNSDSKSPVNKFFLNIPGNTTFTIKENTLYADNGLHLLVIDISNLENIVFVSHIPNQYKLTKEVDIAPDNFKGWFECYDSSKGMLLGWEEKTLVNPRCKKLN